MLRKWDPLKIIQQFSCSQFHLALDLSNATFPILNLRYSQICTIRIPTSIDCTLYASSLWRNSFHLYIQLHVVNDSTPSYLHNSDLFLSWSFSFVHHLSYRGSQISWLLLKKWNNPHHAIQVCIIIWKQSFLQMEHPKVISLSLCYNKVPYIYILSSTNQ